MKKITLQFVGIVILTGIFTTGGQAQEQIIRQKIDEQYPNRSLQQFMYAVSPQTKAADEFILTSYQKFYQAIHQPQKAIVNETSDTTWSYSETNMLGDTLFTPGTYTNYFSIGDTSDFTTYYQEYSWLPDSAEWFPSRIQESFYTNRQSDSVKTLFYNPGQTEPYYGVAWFYVQEPENDADFEQYTRNWNPEKGWVPSDRTLLYRDENGVDTLRKDFSYYEEQGEYLLTMEYRNRTEEDYQFSRYDYYSNEIRTQYVLNEYTSRYQLNESLSYYLEEPSNGYRSYTQKDEDGSFLYQYNKQWDTESMKFENQDSTHFIYSSDNTKTEQEGYFWADSVYVWDEYRVSFQHEAGENTFLVDSILVYDVDYNEETMSREIAGVYIRVEMDYDAAGNQTEVRNYQVIDDSLQMTSHTIREYKLINDYYQIVNTKIYTRDYLTGVLYFGSEASTNYASDGTYLGQSYAYMNAVGDTINAYTIERQTFTDGSIGEVRFEWDYTLKEMVLKSLRVYNRRINGNEGRQFTQNMNVNFTPDGKQQITRSMNGYYNYPGIFNDGPIQIAMGDTLILYVSARNPDMSIPKVEVSNMPSTATFNPETRRFYWVVDEMEPSPMMYKATKGDLVVTTEVEFITEAFTIDVEEEELPYRFSLSQNYPNPFNPATVIRYQVPATSQVTLKVYDLLGREVEELVNESMNAGTYEVTLDASRLASGMYIYRLQAGDQIQTRKMMLIK